MWLTKLGFFAIAIVEDGLPLGALTGRGGFDTRQRRRSVCLRSDETNMINVH